MAADAEGYSGARAARSSASPTASSTTGPAPISSGRRSPTPRAAAAAGAYSYRDLLELKVIKTLLDAGIKLESVRDAFDYLRDSLGEDIATANLVISGNQRGPRARRRGADRPRQPGPGRAQHPAARRCAARGRRRDLELELRPATRRPPRSPGRAGRPGADRHDATGRGDTADAVDRRRDPHRAGHASPTTPSGSSPSCSTSTTIDWAVRAAHVRARDGSPTACRRWRFSPDFYLPAFDLLHRGHDAQPEARDQEEPQGAAPAGAPPGRRRSRCSTNATTSSCS